MSYRKWNHMKRDKNHIRTPVFQKWGLGTVWTESREREWDHSEHCAGRSRKGGERGSSECLVWDQRWCIRTNPLFHKHGACSLASTSSWTSERPSSMSSLPALTSLYFLDHWYGLLRSTRSNNNNNNRRPAILFQPRTGRIDFLCITSGRSGFICQNMQFYS